MFTAEWLVEAYYLRMVLNLSRIIPHFTTLQKFTDRIAGTIHSGKDNFFFFHSPYNTTKRIFLGIDSSRFKPDNPRITVLH
ncbi:MAG TPA: hypothetical protein VFI70_03370 [Nitrososphaeraceae archaeon]|nr:hypothetical protein [Nitrososphaeraceae archaeon]